jgi:catalase
LPASVSFAQTVFHMLHAFRFVNAADEAKYARYHWEPEAGVAGQTLEELQKQPPSYLFEEYEARLRKAPVVFNLVLQLAGNNDPTDDPNAPWPDDRPRVRIGRLEIVRPTTVEEIGDPVMLHDPTRLTDGIEPSDDPILAARRGVYEVSVASRTGGWKGRLAALQRGGCPFGGSQPARSPAVDQTSSERTRIEAALAQSNGKVSGAHGAAAKLGMPPSTLESRIRSLKINKFQFKGV